MTKILLAYSGGLDTSAILLWLKQEYNAEVIAYCCDVGNLPSKEFLESRARELGASDFIFDDAQEEFTRDYVFPLLKAGATYFDDYLLGTAIARPIIAKKAAEAALRLGATHLAHGATGKGNDHIRFEKTWAYFAPHLPIIAPWKTWSFKGRTDLSEFMKSKGFHFGDATKEYSVDCNLLHRSCEGGVLETIEKDYSPTKVQELIHAIPDSALAHESKVKIHFNQGNVSHLTINGKVFNGRADALLVELNNIGGRYGIGLADLVEERVNGIKSRGIYETPGGTLIQKALRSLKAMCWSRELYELSQFNGNQYGKLVYDGNWFTDAKLALDGFSNAAAQKLTGEIELTLSWQGSRISGRQSGESLYDERGVSFEQDLDSMNRDALGYTKILTGSIRRQGARAHDKRS
jgi:argininosuccinate synthase